MQGLLDKPGRFLGQKDQVHGLPDLPCPQFIIGRNNLCQRLRPSGEAQVCEGMQGEGRVLQMLHQEGQSLLPRVQVSSGEKKQVNEIEFSGFAAHFHIAPFLLQMESEILNLMRLQQNIILPPCYAGWFFLLFPPKNF